MDKAKKEFRSLVVEMRAVEDEGKMIIEGYPITFDKPATHWGYTEVIDKHALDNTDMSDVPLKYNHEDSHLILARTRNGSLQLTIDSIGLKMRAELIDTQTNIDIYKSIKSGLLDKMSFAFTTKESSYNEDSEIRTILAIDKLFDVSVVDVPFYDSTSLYARNLDNSKDFAKEFEKRKREKLLNKMARNELLKRL